MPRIIVVHYEECPVAIERFRMGSRFQWEGHVNYIAKAIEAMMDRQNAVTQGRPMEVEVIQTRLDKNSEDIGNLLAPYYGPDAASAFSDLIKAHVENGLATVNAINQNQDTTELKAAGIANGEEIAAYLTALDPTNWPYDTVLGIWKSHLDCTAEQAKYRSEMNYTGEMSAYDSCREGINTLADAFSAGIIDQFPEKFIKHDQPQFVSLRR